MASQSSGPLGLHGSLLIDIERLSRTQLREKVISFRRSEIAGALVPEPRLFLIACNSDDMMFSEVVWVVSRG
jgi:hypothetical protein